MDDGNEGNGATTDVFRTGTAGTSGAGAGAGAGAEGFLACSVATLTLLLEKLLLLFLLLLLPLLPLLFEPEGCPKSTRYGCTGLKSSSARGLLCTKGVLVVPVVGVEVMPPLVRRSTLSVLAGNCVEGSALAVDFGK